MDRGESMWGDGSGGSREDEVVGFGDLEKGRGNSFKVNNRWGFWGRSEEFGEE